MTSPLSSIESRPSQRLYFPNLDGLRFTLAMVVVFSHTRFGEALIAICPFDSLDKIIKVFSTGAFGVSFFFVLSGFLITHLLMEEEHFNEKISIRKFYTRRILRIWPLYYAVLLFSFIIYPYVKIMIGMEDKNAYDILYHLLFLANFDSIRVHEEGLVPLAPMMSGINWSISIEEQFYLVWPLLFIMTRSRKFILVLLAALMTSIAFSVVTLNGPNLYYHSICVLSDFAIGGLFAYICFFHKPFVSFIQQLRKEVIILIYAVGLLWLMYGGEIMPEFFFHRLSRFINSLFFVFVIVEQNNATHSFYKFGSWKRISNLGKYTYALYLLHPIGVQSSILIFRYANINWEDGFAFSLLYFCIAFTVGFILSVLSFRYFESYFLSLRNRFY